MKLNKLIINPITLSLLMAATQGCSSKMAMLPDADRVLSTTDGKNEIPKWVYLQPLREENGRVLVSGVVDISGDQSPSRGLTAADLQARAELAKQIRTRLSYKLQYANEGFGYDNQVLEGIISQASDVNHMSDVRIAERGFAKVLVNNGVGSQVRYTCYSLASVDANELKKMIARSLAEAEGRGQISQSFRKKLDREWNNFFDGGENSGPQTQAAPQATAQQSTESILTPEGN